MTRRVLTLAIGFVLGAGTMLVGLAQAGRLTPARPEALVALAQLVEVEHHRIDVLVERGDIAGAITALEALLARPWPSREDAGDLAAELRHDVAGRLVRLRLDYPEVDARSDDELLATIDAALGSDWRDVDANPFTARLVALRGEVLEHAGRDGDALGAYESALELNRVLLDRELGGAP